MFAIKEEQPNRALLHPTPIRLPHVEARLHRDLCQIYLPGLRVFLRDPEEVLLLRTRSTLQGRSVLRNQLIWATAMIAEATTFSSAQLTLTAKMYIILRPAPILRYPPYLVSQPDHNRITSTDQIRHRLMTNGLPEIGGRKCVLRGHLFGKNDHGEEEGAPMMSMTCRRLIDQAENEKLEDLFIN